MATFEIKQGDTSPTFKRQLLDSDGVALNLSGARITFRMRTFDGTKTITKEARITNRAEGRVELTPNADITSIPTNTPNTTQPPHKAEWNIEWYRGSELVSRTTFPYTDYDLVVVYKRL